ncbi:MAG: cytochrome P450 [Caldilineales bacterium]|nr:cytochrome P450 [Caldilineales bacterium]
MNATHTASPARAPGPPGKLLVGNLLDASRRENRLAHFVHVWQTYGDIVRLDLGPLPFFLLTRPDHVHHVLVAHAANYPKGRGYNKLKLFLGDGIFTSEGDLWRRQRRLLQPLFTPQSVGRFESHMRRAIDGLLAEWESAAASGQELDINQEMMKLAMNVISLVMFGFEIGARAREAADAFSAMLRFVSERSVSAIDLPLAIPTAANRRAQAAMDRVNAFMAEIVAERRADPTEHDDLLALLLAVRDPDSGAAMSEEQLRAELLTNFFAGHETTAQALTWMWYLLSLHPGVRAQLEEELARVLGGRAPTLADLPNLTLTRAIIDETLRLYPPVWGYVRQALAADEIDGYHIPAGAMVMVSPFITHRLPTIWPNPEGFDPGRWMSEQGAGRPKHAYFPFGAGPRVCIGNNFALLEMRLMLATAAQRFHLDLQPGFRPVLESVASLRPAGGMPMTLTPRTP